jgi:penicillin amidase
MGLSAPGFNAVGGALPGVPGLLIGRNNAVAWSMTNGYGDTQDLYVERIDPTAPENYLEGDRSVPFARRVETIRVKDEPDVTLTIRSTRRGPVISDHALGGGSERVLSHRWSVRERQLPELGFDRLMYADSASEADQAIQQISLLTSNIVFADNKGNIGFRASGSIPIRVNRDGSQPQPGHNQADHWAGYIPADQMPGETNPPRGWIASANNDVRPDGYPYYYSSYFSAAYRFTRIGELLSTDQPVAINAHPQFQLDKLNLQARRLVPVLVPLLRQAGHNHLAASLERWNLLDRADSEGALVYHLLYQHLVLAVLTDELGKDLADQFFAKRYHWVERLDQMIESGESAWFDDQSTPGKTEALADLVSRAASDVNRQLEEAFGSDPTWGDAHRILFVSPLRLSGSGAAVLGGGEHAIGGSNETLFRSTYNMGEIKRTRSIDSARMVVDFSDPEKMKGVIAGGHASRQFHASQKSYLADWLNGELGDWWLTPPVESVAASTLVLHPAR